jgi:extradiol dioxygenase family protein
VLELDHLNLHVEDVARSREFYLQVLAEMSRRLLK